MFESLTARLSGQEEVSLKRWAGFSLVNLLIVSVLGVLLRYKGAFYLPVINYKYLLNAHSHFAFSGWISSGLFTAFLYLLASSGVRLSPVYRYQFWLNQVSSFGMLGSFIWQGYGPVSIFFSALSVVFSYWWAFRYWRDSRGAAWPSVVLICARLALLFLVLSSAGPFLLAYSMSHALGDMAFYYNAIYLFLHFQYNGWFSFGVLAIFLWAADRNGWSLPGRGSKWFVGLMGLACVPAYCLSLLWTDPGGWVWIVAALAGLLQLAALGIFFNMIGIRLRERIKGFTPPVRLLWGLSLLAFAIKIFLQALSAVPSLSKLAFGFRPVIIAYLHLVLLGFISLFLVGFLLATGLIRVAAGAGKTGLPLFVFGVFANEGILLLQSLMAFMGYGWESSPYYLLGAALCMLAGLSLLVLKAALEGNPIAIAKHAVSRRL